MSPAVHHSRQPTPAVRYCSHCFLPQAATVQLKMCSRCRVAVYCSKECQKAAWPTHKKDCGAIGALVEATGHDLLDKIVLAFGFKSLMDSLTIFQEFTNANGWAIEALCRVAVRHKLGFDPAPGDITDSIIVGNIECVAPPPSGKRLDPASRFRLRDDRFEFHPLAEFKNTSHECSEAFDKTYSDSRARLYQFHGVNPLFLGTCPVAYRIWPLRVTTFTCCPMFSPLHMPRSFDDDMRRSIFDDMRRLATASMNSGIVLCKVGRPQEREPVPGQLVRAGKKWSFKPLFRAGTWEDSWAAYLTAHPRPDGADRLDDAISRRKADLPLLVEIHVSGIL